MELDRDEGMEELSLVPSPVSNTAGTRPDSCVCDKRCKREGLKFYGVAR